MDQTIIYDAVAHGSDNANIGAVIVTVMFTALFVYVAVLRGAGHRQGRTYVSRSPTATMIWTFVGKYPALVIVTACLVCLAISTPLVARYSRDRHLIDDGGFAVWTGAVSGYTTLEATRYPQNRTDRALGISPTVHEQDQLEVAGRRFYVQCDLPRETRPGVPGKDGKCLKLEPGRRVEVDYVMLSPTEYRGEPLRIRLLAP